MKNSSALFKWPKKLEALSSPKSFDHNSEIAILFSIVVDPVSFYDTSHAHFFSKVNGSKFWDSHFVPHSQRP